MKKTVLFLCTGNSCRSQMAEGFLRHFAGDRFDAASAGTHPSVLNPDAVEAMREAGIDISRHRSKNVDEFVGRRFDAVITVCDRAKESCPIFPEAAALDHWPFDDPAAATGSRGERQAVFHRVRDEIAERIRTFIRESR
ncbi:MAG: arsenate reductase ArsC [Nitrospirae bacterium]|nr:MAG: arsenate reductase ArsC [Nitrospirota bacterium]